MSHGIRRARRREGEVTTRRLTVKCACGKVWSATEHEARELFLATPGDSEPVAFYACRYGGWHWTRQIWRATA